MENVETDKNSPGMIEYSDQDLKGEPTEPIDIDVREKEPESVEQVKFERPEDLPSEFWDEESGNFKGNDLFEAFKKEKERALFFRKKVSEGKSVPPEDPSSYTLSADTFKDELGIELKEDDQALDMAKKVAFDTGLTQDQFENFVTKYLKTLKDSDLINQSNLSEEELSLQEEEFQKNEIAKLGKDANKIIGSVKGWGAKFYSDGVFSDDDVQAFSEMMTEARHVRVIQKIRNATGDMSIPIDTEVVDGMESEQEINRIISSSDYAKDPVLQKKVTDYFNRKYSN